MSVKTRTVVVSTSLIERYAVAILVLFHAIGLGLFLYPNRPLGLSGLNMVLCATLVFASTGQYRREALALVGISIGGFLLEAIGVNTGLLFGTYEYGAELGWKVLGVPVVLGLNWYCVVALGGHLTRRLLLGRHWLLKACTAGLFATGLDFLIEPVAMHYDFWDWEGHVVPLFNYVCWWLFASVFAAGYLYLIEGTNRTAVALLGIWTIFFGVLNAILMIP